MAFRRRCLSETDPSFVIWITRPFCDGWIAETTHITLEPLNKFLNCFLLQQKILDRIIRKLHK